RHEVDRTIAWRLSQIADFVIDTLQKVLQLLMQRAGWVLHLWVGIGQIRYQQIDSPLEERAGRHVENRNPLAIVEHNIAYDPAGNRHPVGSEGIRLYRLNRLSIGVQHVVGPRLVKQEVREFLENMRGEGL